MTSKEAEHLAFKNAIRLLKMYKRRSEFFMYVSIAELAAIIGLVILYFE